MNPLVSVVINCYNGEKYLKDSVKSVFSQSYLKWEIIFIDNCSDDSSSEILFSFNDKRIRYFKTEKKLSLGEARNFALKKVNGELIAFLDVDDIWEPEKLNNTIIYFESDPKIGLVHSNYLNFWQGGFSVANSKTKSEYEDFKYLLINYKVGMSAAVIRKSILDTYDISFNNNFSLVEDFDFFLKVAFFSNVYYTSNILVKYRIHSESLTLKNLNKWSEEFEILKTELQNLLNKRAYEFKKELKWIQIRSINSNILYLIKDNNKKLASYLIIKNSRLSIKFYILFFGVIFGYNNYVKLLSILRKKNYKYDL